MDFRHNGIGIPTKSQVCRPIEICSRYGRLFGLFVVTRHQNRHVRKRSDDSDVLVALVRSAIASSGDSAMGSPDFNIHFWIGDSVSQLISSTASGKYAECGSERQEALERQPRCYA